jgi:hypothetical protein
MQDQIELVRQKLERMDIDDVRDIIGDYSYMELTRKMAQEIVDRYDYEG